MRKPIIAGNWKMNLLQSEAKAVFEGVKNYVKDFSAQELPTIVIAPVFPWITALVLNVIELVCYGKKKISTAKGRELKDFLIIRSVSQLVLLLMR